MKEELIGIIESIVRLLISCGWNDEAEWFASRALIIQEVDMESEVFFDCLDELDRALSGIGSFSDLPLESTDGSRTKLDLRRQQWELAEKLGRVIKNSGSRPR